MNKSHKRSPRHLSDTALILSGRAADNESRMLLPVPRSVRAHGKALERVLQSLLNQGFVEEVEVGLADEVWRSGDDGNFGLRITRAGLTAIGVPALESGLEAGTGDDATTAAALRSPPAARPGSKLARLIELLSGPSGRTIDELATALGWLPHTVRAAISRLQTSGHTVVKAKNDGGLAVYRLEGGGSAMVAKASLQR